MGELRVGTSGWNYPTGHGSWNGVFYPKGRARPKGFDELSFYAEHFDTVEVNSTFYGQPQPETVRRWADRTPSGFEFSIKLYQKFTHTGMFKRTIVGKAPGAREDDPMLDALVRPNESDFDAFRRGIEPLAAGGKLGAVLAQFPASFKNGDPQRDYLEWLLRLFAGYPMAVELRHQSWSDRFGDTLTLLNGFEAAWVQIDEPKFQFSIRQNFLPNIQGFYYMRLHGRNAANWWRHKSSEDRYDYLYSDDELRSFTATADAARQIVKKLYLYTNNHFSAKSVANAAMIKAQLGEPVEGTYPEEFIKAYPHLAGIVKQHHEGTRTRRVATRKQENSKLGF